MLNYHFIIILLTYQTKQFYCSAIYKIDTQFGTYFLSVKYLPTCYINGKTHNFFEYLVLYLLLFFLYFIYESKMFVAITVYCFKLILFILKHSAFKLHSVRNMTSFFHDSCHLEFNNFVYLCFSCNRNGHLFISNSKHYP